jgi:hypothetical protein
MNIVEPILFQAKINPNSIARQHDRRHLQHRIPQRRFGRAARHQLPPLVQNRGAGRLTAESLPCKVTAMDQRIPILIIVDCEPDPRQPQPRSTERWVGFERLFAFLAEQRQRIAARTGLPARFSWFWRMDPQIEVVHGSPRWAVETYRDEIAAAERQGDEIGLHIHGWRWDAIARQWVGDHGNDAWMEHCIRSSFQEFERSFRRRCEVVRMGDGWFSDRAAALLEQQGARLDLTLEPDMPATPKLAPDDATTGLIPDRTGVPHRAYRPSRDDFRAADQDGVTQLWVLPVTTGRAPKRRRGLARFLPARLAPPEVELLQLNLSHAARRFVPIFERAIAAPERPYAAICMRSDGGQPRSLQQIERNIRYLLRHRYAGRFAFVTPSEALAMLR